jgi:transposase InsO family protein
VLDGFSRRVLSWPVSTLARQAGDLQHGLRPQFTGIAFARALIENGTAIRMDGRGAWRDNVFVERLWRGVKYKGRVSAELRACPRPPIDRPLSRLLQGPPNAFNDQSLLQSTAASLGGLTPADAPLIEAESLFRQPEPPLYRGPVVEPSGTIAPAITRCGSRLREGSRGIRYEV